MQPRNLLFIMSDQHRRDAMGCAGHPLVQTPHLDALAARGTRFTNASSPSPICVPARACLATGQHVHRTRHWDNAFPYDGEIRSWGHRLIAEGHRCESIGKLHYRSEEDDDGFSRHHLPLNVAEGVGDLLGAIRADAPQRPGARRGIIEAGSGTSSYLEFDEQIAAEAEGWLQQAAEQPDEQPWMLFVSFVCPHPPYVAPPELFDLYPLDRIPLPAQSSPSERPRHPALEELRRVFDWQEPFSETEIRRLIAAYYGCCTHLDRQIGRVLTALSDNGLQENTRIIYTSDHGENLGEHGLFAKFTMYESSIGIPLILAGPDVPQNKVCDEPVSLVDCYPTILQSMDIPLDEDEQELPGSSLWSIAQNRTLDRPILSEYHGVGSRDGWFMLRYGQYKYIHYVGGAPQLFDLDDDPDELRDLARLADYQPILTEMEMMLREMLSPELVDARAKEDQRELVNRHGGREAVLARGTFTNSPVPGEAPEFETGSESGDRKAESGG